MQVYLPIAEMSVDAFLLVGIGFGVGWLSGLFGFLAETERQVGAHLNRHLDELPAADDKSRAILAQMKTDEEEHAATAIDLGGAELPSLVKVAMQGMSRVMTTTTYHL
jgi:ubiquinone biosynthesis monooxygenase Coq7